MSLSHLQSYRRFCKRLIYVRIAPRRRITDQDQTGTEQRSDTAKRWIDWK